MTDDNARYRSGDLFARTPDAAGHGSDPLAELARLIGQGDQFADIGRDPRHDPPPREPQYYDDPPPQARDERYADEQYADERPYDDARHEAPYPAEPQPHPAEPQPYFPAEAQRHYAAEPEPQYPAEPEPPRYADAGRYPQDPAPPAREWRDPQPAQDWQAVAPPPAFDPFSPSSRQLPEPPLADERAPPPFPPRTSPSEFPFAALHAPRASRDLPPPPPMPAAFDRPEPGPAAPPLHLSRPPQPAPAPLDEYYDDAPQRGRGRGLLTVAAVFMLAVIGTGAAYGFRTWFSAPSVKPAPAVIRANAEPAKVAPPAPAVDPNANKISYDRFADRGQNEKVVPREEKPVDLKEATRSAAATPPAAMLSAQPSVASSVAPAANPPSVLTDPKRVRTVTIRPDQSDPTAVARAPAAAAATATAIAPARPASAAPPANAPLDLANPQQARASAPRPAPPPPPAARPAPAPSSANAPLSLAPENAPLPPPGTRPAPARVAAAPVAAPAASSGGNGNYLVQVSSQRSEADAQAAYRSVRSKYSSVLGDRQPVIRRAEIAGKGTYYRAMVGPFTTRDQAVQLCSSLKAAGGDCVVQAN